MNKEETKRSAREKEAPLYILQSMMTFRDYREFLCAVGKFPYFYLITALLMLSFQVFGVLKNLPMDNSELAGRIIVGFLELLIWLVMIRLIFYFFMRISYRRSGGEREHHSEIRLFRDRLEDIGSSVDFTIYYTKVRFVYETANNFLILSSPSFGSVISKRACSAEVGDFLRGLDPTGRLSRRAENREGGRMDEKQGYELLK